MLNGIIVKKPGHLSLSELDFLSMRDDRSIEDYPYNKKTRASQKRVRTEKVKGALMLRHLVSYFLTSTAFFELTPSITPGQGVNYRQLNSREELHHRSRTVNFENHFQKHQTYRRKHALINKM